MGRFFSTVHIKNNTDRKGFIDSFCEAMKKHSFVPCKKGEAALSYLLAFSEGGWVTLSSDEYSDDPAKASDDVRQIAEEMKTSGFAVEVVDSDFATLKLFGSDHSDEVIVGDGSGYGIEEAPKGKRECWEQLLSEGKTWEQLSEVWERHYVFVEDALCGAAPVLGIESKYMTSDYGELSDSADSDANIIPLYFAKEKDGKKSKSMTLNDGFIKVFGEALEPLGFKKIKCSHPYFVRIIGGEVIHIITYRKMSGYPYVDGRRREDYGKYDIIGKVETIYSRDQDISFPTSHLERYSSFFSNSDIYKKEHFFDFDNNYWHSIFYCFPFKLGDENQIISSFEHAFDVTKLNLLSAIDNTIDLKSYLEFQYKFSDSSLYLDYTHDNFEHFSEYGGLVQIKADTSDSYIERNERYIMREFDKETEIYKKQYAKDPQNLAYYLESVDRKRKEWLQTSYQREIAVKDMFSDSEWCEKALEELERQKIANIETLKSYGLVL